VWNLDDSALGSQSCQREDPGVVGLRTLDAELAANRLEPSLCRREHPNRDCVEEAHLVHRYDQLGWFESVGIQQRYAKPRRRHHVEVALEPQRDHVALQL